LFASVGKRFIEVALNMQSEGGRYMFKKAVIYYPTDEKALAYIHKEIAAFRLSATVDYIDSLSLNDRQIDALFSSLAEDIAAKQEISASA
jgi:hypothetical protein